MGILARLSDGVRSRAAAIRAAFAGRTPRRHGRERRRAAFRLPSGATADPLATIWSDLEWFVTEDPEVVTAMIDLGVIDLGGSRDVPRVRATSDQTDTWERPEIVDVEFLLRELAVPAHAPAHPSFGPENSDSLRAYLEDLGAREDPVALVPAR